jgi:uncharacterized BrkB/YihY/UPF0761 family membrane protein
VIAVLRKAGQITSRIIIAGAAILALTLALSLGFAVVDYPGRPGMRMIFRASLIAGVFIVMAFMMISYLVRKAESRKGS